MDLLKSLPIGLYLEQPITWLHKLDSRVKLGWLMSFLAAPLLANSAWRIGLVFVLILLTFLAAIPLRVWRQQMGWLLAFCALLFVLTCITPDGLAVNYSPRLPESELQFVASTDYKYVLISQSWLNITRRSLDLAIRISTLFFTLIYSTNLYLLTTAPEEITAGLEEMSQPLRKWGVPVTEIMLTLTLSLRFIPLVLEEIQNLIRSVRTRGINWKKLGLKNSFNLWLMVSERVLENLLIRAEQISVAMDIRGFTTPNQHKVEWHQLQLGIFDWIALFSLCLFWYVRITFNF
jgi:energy-coupling factor transport system permease protein